MGDNGNITVIGGGNSGSRYALKASGRLAISDGPMSQISHMCMYEGLVYEFSAYLKLYDQNDQPFSCNKTLPYGDPLACPVLAIEMNTPTEFVMMHPENTVEDAWVADGWNEFRTIFVVSNDLANAEISHFKFKGSAPGVSILIDDMKTELYRPHAINCNQLVVSTNGENNYLGDWQTKGGGYIDLIDDGDNSTKAFAHYARGSHDSGPKQNIETACLEEGQVYDIYARFKFEDSAGNPVGCNKAALFGDPDYCLLFTFQLNGNPLQKQHFGTYYGAPWVASDYNSFHTVVTIDHAMANAESLFFYIQGPSDDKTIIFDNISMLLREESR